jgi:hypothetical protein
MDMNKLSGLNFDTRLKDPILEQAEMIEVRELAKDGLRKIVKARKEEKTLLEGYEIAAKKVDRGRDLYESYDDIAFETKIRIDMIYYDQLLQKLDESAEAEEHITNIYKTVKEIYEHINIKPEIYGRGIDYQFLNESIADQKKTLANIIYEYINGNYYKLDTEKRKEKYLSESTQFAKELIQEGVDTDVAIQRGVKTVVMEGFLGRVAFPQPIQYRIKYLMEDESYGEVFDQASLIELWSKFKSQTADMAKIVSTVI